MKLDKNFKIWGVSFGIIGDLIMGLPVLTYLEKKYPNSYKYWVIEKKCADCAPLYFNHPLIDNIKITDNWSSFGPNDNKLMSSCDFIINKSNWKHDKEDWYNERSCIEETARLANIFDLKNILSEEEMYPKLTKWFDCGFSINTNTYSKSNEINDNLSSVIAIYPFATAGTDSGRSPSQRWWNGLIELIIKSGYGVYHFGRKEDPILSDNPAYFKLTNYSYFEQVKIALATKLCIGTDSGAMWVMGAYSHPCINLITNWLPNHHSNLLALAPANKNGINLFKEKGCDNISYESILTNI